MGKRNHIVGILLLMPCIVLIFGLMLYPLCSAINLSFYKQRIYEFTGSFVGLANYIYLWHHPAFVSAFLRGFIWVGGTVSLQVLLGLGGALILNQKFRGRRFVRGCVLLPFFLPGTSVFLVWRWMYNDTYGIINRILLDFHLVKNPVMWLASPQLALFSVILMAGWVYFPFVLINILARLQTINPQLYEAARIDGANVFQVFTYITLPQIRSVFLVVILLRAIWMFNKFDEIWITTRGGPASSTTTLPILIYKLGFGAMRMGRGAAISATLFLSLVVMSVLYIKLFKPAKTGI